MKTGGKNFYYYKYIDLHEYGKQKLSMTQQKKCPECKKILPVTDEFWSFHFRKDRNMKRTVQSRCKPCRSKYTMKNGQGLHRKYTPKFIMCCVTCGSFNIKKDRVDEKNKKYPIIITQRLK